MDDRRSAMTAGAVWRKLGRIWHGDDRPWMRTHAQNPVAVSRGDLVRVYFSSRDDRNTGHVTYIDLSLVDGASVVKVAEQAVLAPGLPGRFDDCGVYLGSIVHAGPLLHMYYAGWNPGLRPPMFYASIGLAISEDGETFTRWSAAPVLARSDEDPWMVSGPCVHYDGTSWRMWYISGIKFEWTAAGAQSYYDIKLATSTDGRHWSRDGRSVIALAPGERNLSRPCVRAAGGGYEMWFSYDRGAGYRIGCARSSDGVSWRRCDEAAGIDVSESGWDAEAIAYPWVFEHRGRRYLLYSGNRTGKDGLGLAVEATSTDG